MSGSVKIFVDDDDAERFIVLGRCVLALAALTLLLVSRDPNWIRHPALWGEDGVIWFHDAYTDGIASLLQPHTGYLQTFPRLIALLGLMVPMQRLPFWFMSVALAMQMAPVALMLWRGESIIPSPWGRWAMILFYIGMPNTNEVYVNVTNVQWHFGLVLFLLIVIPIPEDLINRGVQYTAILLGGLSGPFSILIAPIAWWQVVDGNGARRPRITQALLLSLSALVQLGCVLLTAKSGRVPTPLGANPLVLVHVLADQLFFPCFSGAQILQNFQYDSLWKNALAWGSVIAGVGIIALAIYHGSSLHRKFALFAVAVLAAGLKSPMTSVVIPQWIVMERTGVSGRYFFFPILLWFASVLVLAGLNRSNARFLGWLLLPCFLVGVYADWNYNPLHTNEYAIQVAFRASVAQFESAAPGTKVLFEEEPTYWHMALVKR